MEEKSDKVFENKTLLERQGIEVQLDGQRSSWVIVREPF
jgi:hypothetical protein